jgi:hypothetical protein
MYSIKLGITKNFRAPLSSPCTASQKNVTRDTGHSGYAMLTSLAVEHMKLNSFFDELEVRKEEVEHLGAIGYLRLHIGAGLGTFATRHPSICRKI